MKRGALIITVLVTCALMAMGQENDTRTLEMLTASLSPEELRILQEDGSVYRYGRDRVGLFYTPMVPLAENIVQRFESIDPDVTVEALFIVDYPDDLPLSKDRDMVFYNIVRGVSSISGVQYFSRTKNRHRVLFDDVYAVDENKKPIDDPLVFSIPPYDSFAMHMKEANLGRDYYLAEYHYDGRDMSFSLTNTTTMSFIFRVVGKEDMQIDLLLMPMENDQLLIYGYCGVKLANPGFVNRIMDPFSSFFRRLYAMKLWFTNTLLNEDKIPETSLLGQGQR